LHEVTMHRSGLWLAAVLISLVATRHVEAREGAGDPPKGLAPSVEDGPFLFRERSEKQ